MSYSKTTWVDNTTPIDKDNLNKIEQGIYDNSLVVDAVTKKLNPTDTETYKTAELTEGQITDVIGISDIVIKGDTEQDGTPTPDSPVDVNVVSGSNVINTGNENLFPLILDVDGTQILQQRCNVIIQKDEFVFTATGTDMYFGNVAAANNAYQKLQGKLIKIPANAQNIYLKVSNNAFSNNFICFFDENKVSLGYSNISTSKEIPSTAKYFTVRIGMSNSVSGTTYRTKVMISTTNKAYIPHQGKELPLNLGNIELCKIGNYQDYFYKSGRKWYLHKEIKKILLNGTEYWSISNNVFYLTSISDYINSSGKICLSDKYKAINNTNVGTSEITQNNSICFFNDNTNPRLYIRDERFNNVNDFKTWLASNNVTLYYVLATVTNTEITDTTLISQLEAIYNAPLYEQTNITQTNNDLPMILDITACKDNINGIKAFIRK